MGSVQALHTNSIQVTAINQGLFADWIAYIDAKPKTVQTYTRSIRQFWRYLQDKGITAPARQDVIAFKDELLAQGKAAATVRAYMVAVKLFFSWASEQGLYPNIANRIKSVKVQANFKKDYLTGRQARNLLESCNKETANGLRDYAIIRLMATTGLRTVEIMRADVEDMGTVGDDTVLYIQGKGRDDKSEYVKLSESVEKAIREYLASRKASKGPLFVSNAHRNAGERMTTRSISRIVKEHMKEVGLNSDRLTAHSLRHTAAHAMINAGENLRNIQRVLRHQSLNTTMIYLSEKNREDNNGELKADDYLFGR